MRNKWVYFFESGDHSLRESPNNACSLFLGMCKIGLLGRDVILTDFSIYTYSYTIDYKQYKVIHFNVISMQYLPNYYVLPYI